MISAEKASTPVSVACELLGVSRSGYYEWASRSPSDRALSDAWLVEKIRAIHAANRRVYGAPRVHAELRLAHGIKVGRKRVERLMRDAGLSGLVPRKRGRTTIRVPGVRVADDLVERRFRPDAPTCCGSLTSPTSGPGRAGSTSPRWARLLAPDRGLVDGRPHAHRARSRRVADGRRATPAGARARSPLRQGSQYVSRRSARPLATPASPVRWAPRAAASKRRRRKLLRDAQERTRPPPLLAHPARADRRGLRVHRSVLQPRPPALDTRLPLPANYENGTLIDPGASLAALRLASPPHDIK